MNNRLYSIQEVADILGVSTKTLRRWDQRGLLVPVRTAGNQRRYTQNQIEDFRNGSSVRPSVQKASVQPASKNQAPKATGAKYSSVGVAESTPARQSLGEGGPFFKEEAKEEPRATHSLPTILSSLPSGSFLREHFLLMHKEAAESSKNDARLSPDVQVLASNVSSKVNLFRIGFVFVALTLIFSFAGSFLLTKYNFVAGLNEKKEQFAKFISNLPEISLSIKSKDLGFVPQEDNRFVLAAATGDSNLLLNVNVPAAFLDTVGIGTTAPDASAILDLTSEDKGFLAPRMTTGQRDAITTPAAGLFVYNTDTNHYNMYNGESWEGVGTVTAIGDVTTGGAFTQDGTEGNSLYFHGTGGGVGQLTGGAISGTQTYTFPNASGEISLLGQSISNAELANSKITISPGTNLTGGGEVALGSSVTLKLKDSVDLAGTLDVSGVTTLDSTLTVAGATTLTGATTVVGATLLNADVGLGDAITDAITFTGRVAQDSSLIPIGVTGTNDLGSLALPWDNLYVDNVFAPASGTQGYWQRDSSALSPTNITDDLLLGSTSTASAKFGFINVAEGDPTATIAGNLSVVVPTTNAPAAALNILNNGSLNIQRSAGGDDGLATSLFIQANGNVGIGTTTPSSLFSVGSTSQFQVNSSGAVTAVGIDSGTGLIQGTGGLTVTGTGNINATGTSATNIGNSTGALTLLSGGTSGWTNTSGDLTIQTASSGTLALTSAGALNLSAGSASTWTLPSSTTALNIGSGLLNFDTANTRIGIGTTTPGSLLSLANNGWLSGLSTSSGVVNMFKVNTQDQIQVGGSLSIDGSLVFPTDGGYVVAADLSLTSAQSSGTANGYTFSLGQKNILTIYGENNGSGVVKNTGVGIGTTAPIGFLNVSGQSVGKALVNLNYTGTGENIFTASASGTTKFVIAGNGNVGIGATPASFALEVAGDVGPSVGSTYDLGSSSRRWDNIYGVTANFTNISTSQATISGTTTQDFLINSDNPTNDTEDATLSFSRGTDNTNTQFKWNSTTKQLTTNSTSFAILPDSTIAYSGTSALMVNQVQSQDILTASASGITKFVINNAGNVGIGIPNPSSFALQVAGSIGPNADNQYDLGSSSLQWKNLYVNNIYSPSTGVSGYFQRNSQALSPTNITDDLLLGGIASSSALIKFSGTANNDSWINTGNVGIGNTSPLAALDITGSASLSADLSLRGTGTAHTFNILDGGSLNFTRSAGGSGASTALFIQANGNVGIGTTAPGSLLSLANNGWLSGLSTSSGVVNMFKVNTQDQIQVGGSLSIDGSLVFPT
ncbi:MAG: MerR family transcriptional regulator, partial [Candidatus Levybacteria bacterium]|nr:MerR family transcriptional regulator [Candidatus Levybacteria bacterium]